MARFKIRSFFKSQQVWAVNMSYHFHKLFSPKIKAGFIYDPNFRWKASADNSWITVTHVYEVNVFKSKR